MRFPVFSRFSKTGIRMVPLDLGPRTIRIPVADIIGHKPGKTLLITAGIDGDEYAGMEAAYHLIERFASRVFFGRLIILPIVNIPGYEAECSLNPLVGHYPKFVFPGDKNGQPTQKLIHWLISTYATQADVWLDLHGGALTERVHPFVWTFETGVKNVDGFTRMLHEFIPADIVVYEKAARSSKAGALARRACVYLLIESGDRIRASEDVIRHVEWTERIMESMNMVPSVQTDTRSTRTPLRRVMCFRAPCNGRWSPGDIQQRVEKGDLLGTYTKINQFAATSLRATTSGVILWYKETASMRKGDVLCAIGR